MLKATTSLAWFAMVAFVFCALCSSVATGQEKSSSNGASDEKYRINNGDVLQISVYQHPEFSSTVVVTGDGIITLPSINAVKAAGLSPTALASLLSLLRDKLESVLPGPQVTVIVKIQHGPSPLLHLEEGPRDILPPQHCCIAWVETPTVPHSWFTVKRNK